MSEPMDARALVLGDEGRTRVLYRDSRGKLTIGIGYDIEDNGLPDRIVDELFDLSFDAAVHAVRGVFNFAPDPKNPRHAALIDMAFELGEAGLRGFIQLRTSWERQDWQGAAAAILDSLYARQVPNRAQRIAELVRSGQWAA